MLILAVWQFVNIDLHCKIQLNYNYASTCVNVLCYVDFALKLCQWPRLQYRRGRRSNRALLRLLCVGGVLAVSPVGRRL